MFPNWHRVCMLVSELHRACILNFALDRVRVRVVYEIPNKTVLISQCSRSKVMPKFETVPGERSASIISSIINLVCPRCGGSMMEFQCNGGCQRNWLPEWEWANLATAIFTPSTRVTKRSADRRH